MSPKSYIRIPIFETSPMGGDTWGHKQITPRKCLSSNGFIVGGDTWGHVATEALCPRVLLLGTFGTHPYRGVPCVPSTNLSEPSLLPLDAYQGRQRDGRKMGEQNFVHERISHEITKIPPTAVRHGRSD